jgi:histidyl-tRNA synthetase
MDYDARSIKAQLKRADRLGARFAAILGDDELARGEATVKDLRDGAQVAVGLGDVAARLRDASGADRRRSDAATPAG